MIRRNTYVIDAENGVGLFLSKVLADDALKRLSLFDRRQIIFEDYESAKNYIFGQYKADPEMDLEHFRPNHIIFRNKSNRYNFYVYSPKVIAFGIDWETREALQLGLSLADDEIVETDTTWQAEYSARGAFAEIYGDERYYYGGRFYSGESISFAEMLRANGLGECIDKIPKFFGKRN